MFESLEISSKKREKFGMENHEKSKKRSFIWRKEKKVFLSRKKRKKGVKMELEEKEKHGN